MYGVVDQLFQLHSEVASQRFDRHVPDLPAARIEHAFGVRQQMSVLESDSHMVGGREDGAHISRARMVKPDSVPAQIDPLGDLGYRRSDQLTYLESEVGYLREVVVEEILDRRLGQTDTSRPRSAKSVNSGRKVMSTLPVDPARCLATITSAKPLVSCASGW